ncbi:MAG: SMP-30/gluconolactonase/LRE family protein [Ginsengibacter sp.]
MRIHFPLRYPPEIPGNLICFIFIASSFFIKCTPGRSIGSSNIADTGIIAPGVKPVMIDSGFIFTEGPATDKKGNVFFTDQPNNKIWKYDTEGKLSVFSDKAGRSNGMYFDAKGNLITCADENGQLWSIDPEGKVTVLVKDYQGHRLNGPNDLWIHPSGGIYFTDPYFQRSYWTRKHTDSALGGDKVYYLSQNKKELIMADSETVKPNGIVGTPDGKYLYVADMGKRKTYRYDINKDGTLNNKQVFANEASDGMTIDNRGNIYLTGRGVAVYDPAGKKIEQIDIPEKWTANICFGGKNRRTLFITASKSIYIIPTLVSGVE